ncbi:MAG TPA: hypothetical protein K8V25_08440 [Megamonas hypermegale]|uniref:Uncharacterized protein n=1 Tax=Megamonas hypermegale TaxID=158847 RepID=A0A921L782_9FIRM|nr:hypothetical protein [Megamonas hypermegale]HJF84569.1 hypothetical protein [Megamonas hypermegale]HJG08256.1 hypothetical protein [Megamonas hypermegale]
MYTLKNIFSILVCVVTLNFFTVSIASADISDVTDIATNAVSTVVSEDNEKIKNEIMNMLNDDIHKKELQNYIIETRPIIEKYQSRLETAEYAAYFSEKYIPLVGGLFSSVIVEGAYYFYENDLEEAAKTPVAKNFSTLRNNGIDFTKDLISRTISYGVEKEENTSEQSDIDISTVINVGIKHQQKQALIDYMKEIMEKSNISYDIIDTGCSNNFGI